MARRVAKDALEGVPEAGRCVGLIDRKLVKQTVMTSVYGVTAVGARAQVEARLRERRADMRAREREGASGGGGGHSSRDAHSWMDDRTVLWQVRRTMWRPAYCWQQAAVTSPTLSYPRLLLILCSSAHPTLDPLPTADTHTHTDASYVTCMLMLAMCVHACQRHNTPSPHLSAGSVQPPSPQNTLTPRPSPSL